MKKSITLLIVMLIIGLMVVGCSDNVPPQNNPQYQGAVGGGCGVIGSEDKSQSIQQLPMDVKL